MLVHLRSIWNELTGWRFLFVLLFLACDATVVAQEVIDPESAPEIMTHLPGTSSRIERLSDGTLVTWRMVRDMDGIAPFNAVFTASSDDPLQWTDSAIEGIVLQQNGILRLAGGDRNRLIFLVDVSLGIAGKPNKWRALSVPLRDVGHGTQIEFLDGVGPFVSIPRMNFASANVGAFADGLRIHLTTDAGTTWKHVYDADQVRTKNQITGLLWLDIHRLLVTTAAGRAELLTREGDTLTRAWESGIQSRGVHSLVASRGDAAVASGGRIELVDLDTGRVGASIEPRVSFDNLLVDHGRILLWQAETLVFIRRKGVVDQAEVIDHIQVPVKILGKRAYIAGVVPVDKHRCLVFTTGGHAIEFDLDSCEFGELIPLRVALAQHERTATKQQISELAGLMRQLSPERRTEILKKGNAQNDLDRREKTDWIIARMRKVIEEAGPLPEPVLDPTQPTGEQITAFIRISGKLPSETKFSIILEAREIPDLTEKERMEWMIEKMHEAVGEIGDQE